MNTRLATTTRPLAATDLERVIAIDAAYTGRSRQGFFEKRLEAALRAPKEYVYLGCADGGPLQGFLLARLVEGEYGVTDPLAALDAIGVDPQVQHRGLGQTMLGAMDELLRHKGVRQMVTQADWRNHGMLTFFDRAGFQLAPRYILERDVGRSLATDAGDEQGDAEDAPTEIDYSTPGAFDYIQLARDRVGCRSLRTDDFDALVRIDRKILGRDRSDYYQRKLAEVFDLSGIRVSMVAELDDHVVGFIMARVDFGEFARTEPVAVLDIIDVDPGYQHRRVATALLAQLLANLTTLRVDRIRTSIDTGAQALFAFFVRNGFIPSQQIPFIRTL